MINICTNPYRDENMELTSKAVAILEKEGFETRVSRVFTGDHIENLEESDLIIVIGGDGTILSVVSDMYRTGIPVLGVNLGTKGFMTSLESEDIEHIADAAKGNYSISERMMLDVFLDGKKIGAALNDAVIHGYGDCISLDVLCDSTRISKISGDGIVLATPTGSTGYSMSAGGPIVEPETKSIIVSPICAHSIGSRSFVLDPKRSVNVEIQKLQDKKAYLSIDGRTTADLDTGSRITVKKSKHTVKMVDMGVKSFYETAFEKL